MADDNFVSFVDAVKQAYPAHYAVHNTELYFSNMLLADLGLQDKAYRLWCYVNKFLGMEMDYVVTPRLLRNVSGLFWIIRYKIMHANLIPRWFDENQLANVESLPTVDPFSFA